MRISRVRNLFSENRLNLRRRSCKRTGYERGSCVFVRNPGLNGFGR